MTAASNMIVPIDRIVAGEILKRLRSLSVHYLGDMFAECRPERPPGLRSAIRNEFDKPQIDQIRSTLASIGIETAQ
ncbi:hypothetical protein KGP36_04735 [Patescibacteria group bacterium]|nr:hypothetical protein [Patescibacteria group bacterium]MDE1941209.1 hypothetical protein [Patescibacteria group bacterium]